MIGDLLPRLTPRNEFAFVASIDGQAAYDQIEVSLDEGDLLLFYTDALVEAVSLHDQPLGQIWSTGSTLARRSVRRRS